MVSRYWSTVSVHLEQQTAYGHVQRVTETHSSSTSQGSLASTGSRRSHLRLGAKQPLPLASSVCGPQGLLCFTHGEADCYQPFRCYCVMQGE